MQTIETLHKCFKLALKLCIDRYGHGGKALIAHKSDVSPSLIGQILNPKLNKHPKIETQKKIAEGCGYSYENFMKLGIKILAGENNNNNQGESLMDIFNLKIVKQTNGKFAVWNETDQRFVFENKETAEEIKDYYVDKVDRILTENILSYAEDDTCFKHCVEAYKIKHGLDLSPREAAVATLEGMGVSVQGI